MLFSEYIDLGLGYIITALTFIRNLFVQLGSLIGMDGNLLMLIAFLLISLVLSYFLVKKFVTKPLASSYIVWYIIIALLMFLVLAYL